MNEVAAETKTGWIGPMFVILIGTFMALLDASVVNVALPKIMTVFGAKTEDVEWVATAYMLALGVVETLSGWLGNKLGLKRLYIYSMAVFAFGSLLCTASWSVDSLILARIVQAVGGGTLITTAMAMIYRMVPRERIGGAMGIFMIGVLVAPAIGPTFGGYLVDYVDWRWIFTINVPIGVIGVILAAVSLPEFKTKEAGKFDTVGFLTAAGGLSCLLYALTKGIDWGWTDERIVLLLYFSATFIGLFIYVELTAENPLLDLRVFRYPSFTLSTLTIAIVTISLFTALFYIPLFVQNIRGLSAMRTGMLLIPMALASSVTMPVAGRLYDRIGPRVLVLIGLGLLMLLTWDIHFLNLNTSLTTLTLWLLLGGLARSLAGMPAQASSLADIPTELISRASAIFNIISRISGSFGVALFTGILNNRIAVHAQRLADNAVPWNPNLVDFAQRTIAQIGGNASNGRTIALAYLQGLISKQAFVRAIDDVFIISAALTLLAVVPALFLKKSAVSRSAVMGEGSE